MLKYVSGDIFESNAEAIINTVNCQGTMGKGIALQFKKRYPKNFEQYYNDCKEGVVKVGNLTWYKEQDKLVINFPTKDKWRAASKIEYINDGLDALTVLIESSHIKSIAMPPLGCGNGGLEWKEVKALIDSKLSSVSKKIDVYIYEPINSSVKEIPRLSKRQLLLMKIKVEAGEVTANDFQKIVYLVNALSGDDIFAYESLGTLTSSLVLNDLKTIKKVYIESGYKNIEDYYNHYMQVNITRELEVELSNFSSIIKKSIEVYKMFSKEFYLLLVLTISIIYNNNNISIEEINKVIINDKTLKDLFDKSNFSVDKCLTYLETENLITKDLLGYSVSNSWN